jgi:predicted permease
MSEHLRTAVRGLMRSPGFALTAILTLALGIGLSTAVFTIAESILVRRLPVADQDRLVLLWGKSRDGSMSNVPLALSDIRAIERQSATLRDVAFFAFRGASPSAIRVDDRVHAIQLALVSGNYFNVLGAHPALGRTLRSEDDVAGGTPVIVLSHRAWQQYFAGDSSIVGKSITFVQSARTYSVVGVMPDGLDYPKGADLWAPVLAYSAANGFNDVVTRELDILARLRPGASPTAARAELTSHFSRSNAAVLHRNAVGVVHAFAEEVLGDTRPAVITIGFAAALLLFVSCVNVANLLLIRTLGRARELVVRSALGASRMRLLVHSLAECGVLSLGGGLLGAALAVAAVRAFAALVPPNLAEISPVAVNGDVLVVAIFTTIAAVLTSGVGPALLALRVDANQVLRSGSHSTGSPRIRVTLEALVAAQMALAVISLTSAGVMTRSFVRLMQADLSFRVDNLLVAPLTVTSAAFPEPSGLRSALELVVERVRALPNVEAASLAYAPPFIGGSGGIDGALSVPDREAENPFLNLEIAPPGYFATLGMPVVRGRPFTDDDRDGAARVVIVSESVARHYWPGQDPIGKRMTGMGSPLTVVGVVPDARYRDLRTARSSAYFPLRQSPFGGFMPTTLVIRTTGAPATVAPQLRRLLDDAGPGLTMSNVTAAESLLNGPRAVARLNTVVLVSFAGAAVLLAALGLFAILVMMVRRRTHELGVRMALGASARDIRMLIMRRGMVLASAGGLVGIALTLATSRVASSVVFEALAADAATIGGVAGLVLVVALVASVLPARTSARIDPAIALRIEP